MSRASELADKLKAAAADPMWAGHCEISKRTCDFAALELERLDRVNAELVEALQAQQNAQAMPVYGDYSDFVWPKVEMRTPGETAWGWICEKHGLGYTGACVCCDGEWKRHQDRKDREARNARDDALQAASNKARAALSAINEWEKSNG